jgi:hypothetical protein
VAHITVRKPTVASDGAWFGVWRRTHHNRINEQGIKETAEVRNKRAFWTYSSVSRGGSVVMMGFRPSFFRFFAAAELPLGELTVDDDSVASLSFSVPFIVMSLVL